MKIRFPLLVTVLALAGNAAVAADLPSRIVKPAAPYVPAFSWTGCYGGVDAGYTWGQMSSRGLTGYNGQSIKMENPSKGTVGAFVGCNYALTPMLIGGLELDVTKFGHTSNYSAISGASGFGVQYDAGWGGSFRGRLGMGLDRLFVYGTGGIAVVQQSVLGAAQTGGVSTYFSSKSKSSVGYVVGLGADHAIAPNWFVRGEYLYTDLPSVKIDALTRVGGDFHTVRLGLGYKF